MVNKEFKAFNKIERIGKLMMHVTQKIHGTNAQVYIFEENGKLDLLVGSRTRWITPENDNYGFATFVYNNKDEFITKLGVGQHFGEWAGPGINSGEGLAQKQFVLFDFWKYPPDRELPPCTTVVPVLYKGQLDFNKIQEAMNDLKTNGSKLVPGYTRPEGVVVSIGGTRYKNVFEPEETQWQRGDGNKDRLREARVQFDSSSLLQPIRLEKLLSKDENYLTHFPDSLPTIVKDYLDDLISEGQIVGTEDEILTTRKLASRDVFNFIKTVINREYKLHG